MGRFADFVRALFSSPQLPPEAHPIALVEPRQIGELVDQAAAAKPRAQVPRVYCPVCGRDVAITKDGITFDHLRRPGTLDRTRHRVRIIDSAEVVVNGIEVTPDDERRA